MDVIYKCRCMKEEATVSVPDRPENADIIEWMVQILGSCLAYDHKYRTPACHETKMEYVKIPFAENAPGIGMKPKLDS